jgi:hypothetical protein
MGLLRFTGEAVELEEVGDAGRFGDWQELVPALGAGLVAGMVAGIAVDLFGRIRSRREPATTSSPTAVAIASSTPATAAATSTAVVDVPSAMEFTTVSIPESVPADAPVSDVASRIAALSAMSDELLADLFKVERETFCRWRTGALPNPRVGNRRRLGRLLRLLEDLSARDINIKDWLLNSITPYGATPYQLLARGRIDDVAFLATAIGEEEVQRDSRLSVAEEPESLQFGDDDSWDYESPEHDES